MRNSYDVIEVDIYVYYIFVYRFELKHAEPNIISKIFKTNIILIMKYLNLNWNIVKSLIFILKMVDFK